MGNNGIGLTPNVAGLESLPSAQSWDIFGNAKVQFLSCLACIFPEHVFRFCTRDLAATYDRPWLPNYVGNYETIS